MGVFVDSRADAGFYELLGIGTDKIPIETAWMGRSYLRLNPAPTALRVSG